MPRRWKRALIAVLLGWVVVTSVGGWVAGNRQVPVTGPAPGAEAWRADRVLGRRLPDPATASPERVAAFFAGLTPVGDGLSHVADWQLPGRPDGHE